MTGTYNYWLVALSVLVAIFASYTALDLATRIMATRGAATRAWLIGGAFSMGIGIWSMHFIGMLAFSLPVPVGYDVPVTLLSLLIAVVVSSLAFYTVSRERLSWRNLLIGGVLMGFGICALHYTGMAAMEMSPPVRYEPSLFAASVVIAIVASHAALFIAFTLRGDATWMAYAKIGSAVIMGFAITGMHYTGMAAARFSPDTVGLTGAGVDNSWMAITLGAVTFLILCVTLVLAVINTRMASKTAKMAASLKSANDKLQRRVLHDALTKLPNRVLLEGRIDQARMSDCLVVGLRDLAQQYYELVAAEARDCVFEPHGLYKARCDGPQDLIAGAMTKRVVDLQPAQVHEQHGATALAAR